MFYMALEEEEDGGRVITEEKKHINESDLKFLLNKTKALEEENAELKRRIKKYCNNRMMEQDNIYNRAAGQERGE